MIVNRLAGLIHWVPLEGPGVDASNPPDVGAPGGEAIIGNLPVTGVGCFDDHPDAHTTLGRADGVFGALKWPHRGHGEWNYTMCPSGLGCTREGDVDCLPTCTVSCTRGITTLVQH
jgi:hypothetical protein